MSHTILKSTVFLASLLVLASCGGGDKPAAGGGTGGGDNKSAAPAGGGATGGAEVDLSKAGKITGKVSFDGTAPTMSKILITEDACKKQHESKPLLKEEWVVNNGAVKNVLVHVKTGLEGKKFPASAMKTSASIDQTGCQYVPHFVGVTMGGKLSVKNSDPIMHNAHGKPSTKTGNIERNFAQAKLGQVDTFDLIRPESLCFKLMCDVHSWMTAYCAVLPHPCFAISGDDGTFTIDNVPPGKYTVEAWHESGKTQTMEVEVKEGGTAKADFTLKA